MNEDISKSAVINELAERMINLGYVEENFKEEIWKRETQTDRENSGTSTASIPRRGSGHSAGRESAL